MLSDGFLGALACAEDNGVVVHKHTISRRTRVVCLEGNVGSSTAIAAIEPFVAYFLEQVFCSREVKERIRSLVGT